MKPHGARKPPKADYSSSQFINQAFLFGGGGGAAAACFLYRPLQQAGNAASFSSAIKKEAAMVPLPLPALCMALAPSSLFLEGLNRPWLHVLARSVELESASPDVILKEILSWT